jgi:hypothetical protein
VLPPNAGSAEPNPMRQVWLLRGCLYAALGCIYGVWLKCTGIAFEAGRHGTRDVMRVLCSPMFGRQLPFSYIEVAPPFFWLGMGTLLGGVRNGKAAYAFVALMVVYYIVLLGNVINTGAITDISYRKIGDFDFGMLAIYPLGQVVVWILFSAERIGGKRCTAHRRRQQRQVESSGDLAEFSPNY